MNSSHDDARPESRPLRSPLGFSLLLAFIYLLISVAHIFFSDRIVAGMATSSDEINRLQTYKGLAFVTCSALLVFMLANVFLRRIARDQKKIAEQQRELIIAERRAATEMLAHSIAHNMNNILTVGMANAEMLRIHGRVDAEGAEMLNDITRSLDRIREMSRRMSRSGHPSDKTSISRKDLVAIIRQEIRYIQSHHNVSDHSITYHGPDNYTALLYESSMRDMLDNLLLNAAEAAGSAARIEVRLKTEPTRAILEIHDNGPGIPPAQREQVLQPLFTTKETGMGLGLLSAKSTAKQHLGHLEILASSLGGACFSITLPRMDRVD